MHIHSLLRKKQLLFIKPLENFTESEADKLCAAVPKDDTTKVCTCTCTCVSLHFCDLICAVLCVFLYINDWSLLVFEIDVIVNEYVFSTKTNEASTFSSELLSVEIVENG